MMTVNDNDYNCGIFISKHDLTVSVNQHERSFYGCYSCIYKTYVVFWRLAPYPAWAEGQDIYSIRPIR
jgi:hypothetical protein